jgi:hypothetical protein
MNPENDDLGAQLTRELHRRTDGMHDTPLMFDDVRGKATSIRRRRQLATGLGVAAAVAVIVPTAMFATKDTTSDGQQPATRPPTVSDTANPTPTSTPTMGSDPHALDVRDLPTGAPPAVTVLTSGDDAMAETAEARVRLTDGGVVVEAGGQSFGPYPSSHGLSVNAAATAVAWTTDEGEVMVWADGGGEPFKIAGFGTTDVRVAAVTGTDCVRGKASDCLYYVSYYDMETGQSESVKIDGDGAIGNVDPDRSILAVRDATESGRVLGITEFDDSRPGTCSVVLDPAMPDQSPLLETCDYTLDEFSPDGSYVLASDTYGDGIGSGVIAIFATVGDRQAYRSNTGKGLAFYNDAVWEDEGHVLFTRYLDGMWSIVRMDVNGALEFAVPPEPGDEMEVPYRFQTT